MESTDRRAFLTDASVAGSALLLGGSTLLAAPATLPQAKLVRTIRFRRGRRTFEKVYGTGWHGRYIKDLSLLDEKKLITPNEEFYIRTRAPKNLPKLKDWKIALRDAGRDVAEILATDLIKQSKNQGVRLLECSGNGGSFGLISAAAWSGVPILDVVDGRIGDGRIGDGRIGEGKSGDPKLDNELILVDGHDDHANMPKNTLQAGCSWIFKRSELKKAGAFLATGMNGVPLPADHGHPVRLFVPGWYGCTCVKWVRSIEVVDPKAKSTRHMREYSSRTHQKGSPRRAKDFQSATMDTAAVPIKIEEWKNGKESVFKIIGIVWGGTKPVTGLDIHIGNEDVVPVSNFQQKSHSTWSLWSHEWKSSRDGRFDIWLTVRDEGVRTRRLDRRYYRRRFQI